MDTEKTENRKLTNDERRAAGQLFKGSTPDLAAQKLHAHELCTRYNQTLESDRETRNAILHELLGEFRGGFIQGPIYFNYGIHTKMYGVFIQPNLTIQDDAEVILEQGVALGPGCTIVTPVHPMVPSERRRMLDPDGNEAVLFYAKPVHIGKGCWIGANVTIGGGVTIGDGSVIGMGSVVTRDIPPGCFAAGNPCRVIRKITEADSMIHKPEILADNQVIPEE